MKNQLQTKVEKRVLAVVAMFCYVLALTAVVAFSYTLVTFALRMAAQQTSALYSLPRYMLNFSLSNARAQNSRAADEAALRETVKQLETGWNTKSGALFARAFAEDADYVVINGRYIKGRPTIESAHQRIFDTIFKDTTVILTVKQIRFLRPDVAVVHVSGQHKGPTKELMQNAMLTLVMTKEKESWTIAAFQNTPVVSRE